LTITPVFGGDQPNTTLLQQSANDGLLRSIDDFHNSCFWAPFAIQSGDSCDHSISVYDSTHFIRRQIHIDLAVVALYKAMTIAVALYSSLERFKKSCAWS